MVAHRVAAVGPPLDLGDLAGPRPQLLPDELDERLAGRAADRGAGPGVLRADVVLDDPPHRQDEEDDKQSANN